MSTVFTLHDLSSFETNDLHCLPECYVGQSSEVRVPWFSDSITTERKSTL